MLFIQITTDVWQQRVVRGTSDAFDTYSNKMNLNCYLLK